MKKKLIAVLTEILFLACLAGFLLYMKASYSTASDYDLQAFFTMACAILSIAVLGGPKLGKILTLFTGSLYTLYLIAQTIYRHGFDDYFRLMHSMSIASEVQEVSTSVAEFIHFEDFIPYFIFLGIILVFFILSFILEKGYRPIVLRLFCIPLFLFSFLSYKNLHSLIDSTRLDDPFDEHFSDYGLYTYVTSPSSFVERLGLLTYEIRDYEFFFERNADHSEDIQVINEYFESHPGSMHTNSYTGMFKGKSFLIVQAESLVYAGIDETLTPNLYKFLHEGIVVDDFFTPLMATSTSDTELMANLSMIPIAATEAPCYAYGENTFPYDLPRTFEKAGYVTSAFHNNHDSYFNRSVIFPTLGYEHFFTQFTMGYDRDYVPIDTEVMNQLGWIICEHHPFLSYWITIDGHQPYRYLDLGSTPENLAKVQELYPGLDETYVSYLSKSVDLDQSLGNFLQIMEWMNRDDYVLVIFGDHHTKTINWGKGSNYDKVMGNNSDDDPSLNQTPLIIYSPSMTEGKTIHASGTVLDLIPTIANLAGIDYDMTHTLGSDLLDDEAVHYRFDVNGNVYTTDFTYDSATDTYTLLNDRYSIDQAKEVVRKYLEVYDISYRILRSDYYAKK